MSDSGRASTRPCLNSEAAKVGAPPSYCIRVVQQHVGAFISLVCAVTAALLTLDIKRIVEGRVRLVHNTSAEMAKAPRKLHGLCYELFDPIGNST
mmetsp:Transcript_31435/g.94034  ORF Transcript_31435/g.94034 Transcript_31435/m.94034 type:complete len:95 (-) Transcript_31435:702-986(-)